MVRREGSPGGRRWAGDVPLVTLLRFVLPDPGDWQQQLAGDVVRPAFVVEPSARSLHWRNFGSSHAGVRMTCDAAY